MKTLVALVAVLSLPIAAYGQATIVGAVTDSSGAPLSGVHVEASSPELIERIRTATTNAAGRYRLENLRPGVYKLRFTLSGWSPLERERIELTGAFTAAVDAQLALGALSDTITVTRETSAVDVHGVRREITLGSDVTRSLPTARSYNALLVLIPGVVTSVNDTVTGTASISFPIHGGRTNEGRLQLDGLNIGSPPSGNSATSYTVDVGQAQEVTFSTAGALGESETAGLVMNIVPKTGGNSMRGSFFASGGSGRFQSDNVTPELSAQGVIVGRSAQEGL